MNHYGPNTYGTQEGAVFDMEGALCPNGHESKLSHISGVAGYFRCPTCNLLYDEPVFAEWSFMGMMDDDDKDVT